MSRVFISYSSKDKRFAEDLARSLKESGVNPWIDLWEIRVGDSIIDKIDCGISESDYVVAVISPNSIASRWVKEELNSAKMIEINANKTYILPIVIANCKLPPFLAHKRYADFRYSYTDGLIELLAGIGIELSPDEEYLAASVEFKDLVLRSLSKLERKFSVHSHSIHILFQAKESHAFRLVMIGAALDYYSQRFRFATMNGLIGNSFQVGKTLNIPDVKVDDRYFRADIRTKSELVSPIFLKRQVVGIINIESIQRDGFSSNDMKYIESICTAFGKWCANQWPIEIDAKRAPYWEMSILTEHSGKQ